MQTEVRGRKNDARIRNVKLRTTTASARQMNARRSAREALHFREHPARLYKNDFALRIRAQRDRAHDGFCSLRSEESGGVGRDCETRKTRKRRKKRERAN